MGENTVDICDLQEQVPEVLPRVAAGGFGTDTLPVNYCRAQTSWLTQVKLIGSYTLPYDIEISGTLQNQPGPHRAADHADELPTAGLSKDCG